MTSLTYEEIFRASLDIRSRSGDELVGLCPFHGDSTPSLWANTKKGLWTCYACGVGGSAAGLMRRLGVSTPAPTSESGAEVGRHTTHIREVLQGIEKRAAGRRCGCDAVYSSTSSLPARLTQFDSRVYTLGVSTTSIKNTTHNDHREESPHSGSPPGRCPTCSRSLVLPEKYLQRYPSSTSSVNYLLSRGISSVDGTRSTPSTSRGVQGGVDLAALFELGWHTLSGSLTIPYRDEEGRLLGVVHRRMKGRPKYVYPVKFPRTETMFGSWLLGHEFPWLRRDLVSRSTVVLTEGSLDAVKVWQAGLPAVSMWGSQLHDKQVQILSKLGIRTVVVFTDRDAPGRSAALSAAGKLMHAKKLVKVVRYPKSYPAEYSDPGSLPTSLIRARVRRARWLWE